MSKWRSLVLAGVLLFAPVGGTLEPKDETQWWPQFLGPNRNGIAPDKGLNHDWKAAPPKVLWKVPLGDGFGSFSVVGNRLFTLCERKQRGLAVCLDSGTGKEIWTSDLAVGYLDKQKQGAGPRATPTYHDGKLYCLFPMGELACVAAAHGKVLWTVNQFKAVEAENPVGGFYYWGASLSPLIEGDLVIVQPGGKKNNSVAAFHKHTGKLVWAVGDDPPSYSSPVALTIAGTRQIVVQTGTSVMGIEPLRGTVLWRYQFPSDTKTASVSPLWVDGLLFVSAAYGAGSALLEIKDVGGKWDVVEKWKSKKVQTLFATAMIVDGKIYCCHGDLGPAFLKCADLKTGDILWEQRIPSKQWLMAVDGCLLGWSETGDLTLLALQPTRYELLAELPKLLQRKSWAAPAMADGRLYVRDQKNAVCVDLRK